MDSWWLVVLVVLGVGLGICITAVLGMTAPRRGKGPHKPVLVALVAVLVLAIAGGVVWVRARTVNVPAPVSASLTLFVQGDDCAHDDNSSNGCAAPHALFALRARDGSVRWEAFAPAGDSFVGSGPFFRDGVVYAYTDNRADFNSDLLIAWRASDGAELWRVRVPVQGTGAPQTLVLGSQLAIVTAGKAGSDGRPTWQLTLLRASDGATAGSITLPPAGTFGLVAADDSTLYDCLADGTGTLFAVRLSDGARLWSVPSRGSAGKFPVRCIPSVADGIVFAAINEPIAASGTSSPVDQGRLVALRARWVRAVAVCNGIAAALGCERRGRVPGPGRRDPECAFEHYRAA
jgi:hypothetical protein